MKADSKPRFDAAALRNLAGDKVFGRGEAYAREGQVEILSLTPQRVLARVLGTEEYRTVLTGRGKSIGGECSCPAFEDWGFCKHMVAAALVANKAQEGSAEFEDVPDRIRRYLKEKGADALAEMILDYAESDPILFRQLEVASSVRFTDGKALEVSLRKALDDATHVKGYVEYRQAEEWASGVMGVLETIGGLADRDKGGVALRLAEHALERIRDAILNIDDSNGWGGGLLEKAAEIHLQACQVARPDPIALAGWLFERETSFSHDTFAGAAWDYEDVLGKGGMAEYRRLAGEAWKKIPAGKGKLGDESYHARYALFGILDGFAERDGDVEARVALRRKRLQSQWDYLELAEFCLKHVGADAALRWAREGLWVCADSRPDERLIAFAADRLLAAGQTGEALGVVRQAFDKAPSTSLYELLRRLGGESEKNRVLRSLEERYVAENPTRQSAVSNLMMEILLREKSFDAAWAWAKHRRVDAPLRLRLAFDSAEKFPADACVIFAAHAEELVSSAAADAYVEAARIIKRMALLQPRADHDRFVSMFKARHGRKRSFIAILEAGAKRGRS